MTVDDLKEFEKVADAQARAAKRRAQVNYAKFHQKYDIGQILELDGRIIQVESIQYSSWMWGEPPVAIYVGARLRKDLQPYRSGEVERLYQCDRINVISS